MFDPKKLNLDLENLDKEEQKESTVSKEKTDIFETEETKKENNKETEKVENKEKAKDSKQDDSEKNYKEFKEKIDNKSSNTGKEEKENNNDKSNKEETTKDEKKIIYDININSINDLLKYLVLKKYDFFTITPTEDKAIISFRKKNVEQERKYIKYHIYSDIILKAKNIGKLDLTTTTKEQENKTGITYNNQKYEVLIKTKPSEAGEKIFFKMKEISNKKTKAKKEKMSIGKMLSIFAGLLVVAMLVGGIFMAIVILNSNSIEDLKFFHSIGVNANAIRNFAYTLINVIFGFIVFIEIIFLFIFAYKALLTKKIFKKEKRTRIIISIFFLVLTIFTFIFWIYLAKKLLALKGLNYGKIEYYDNDKYISPMFSMQNKRIDINENLIGPVTIRFDNSEFIQKLRDEGFTPKKVIWEVGKEKIDKGVNDQFFIHKFDKKGLFNVKLSVIGLNLKGEEKIKEKDIPLINVNNIVDIKEKKLKTGGKIFIFNASDLDKLGKIYWYHIPDLKLEGKSDNEINKAIVKAFEKPALKGYIFTSDPIFEGEKYYAFKVISGDITKEKIQNHPIDKVFIIGMGEHNDIQGNIKAQRDIENYKKYSFLIKDPETKFGGAYIEEYIWELQDFDAKNNEKYITLNKKADLSDLENSSKITYTFKKAGKHIIKLSVIDSQGNKHNIGTTILNIEKRVYLKDLPKFKIEGKELDYKKDIKYEEKDNIYYLDNIGAPTILEIDTSRIKTKNPKYWLTNVRWDLDGNGTFEKFGKKLKYDINTAGLHTIKVKFEFKNKKNPKEKIYLTETISIGAIDKDAILNLEIIKENSYVPVNVSFDASKSKVTGKNIDKFIFDYGDGTPPEARDAQNTGHKYTKPGDYNVTLTVITDDGIKYSLTKKLILKKRAQKAVITTSMRRAPIFQPIDFSAEQSTGEVATYFWDFGDREVSTEASPSHFYKKAGKYKVKLTLTFTNNNELTEEKEIEIYE